MQHFLANFIGQYCQKCTAIIKAVNELEGKLNRADFSFDRDDEVVAKQIHDVLQRENSVVSVQDEEVLRHLIERRITDEKRRLRILQELRRLQDQKK